MIEKISIDKLIPYANNARTHSDEQVAQIAASIREFGFNNPVLIAEDDTIIAGHGRVMAAQKLNLSEVPFLRLSHLTETQRKAYILADNKLALNAAWDVDLLKLEIQDLMSEKFAVELTGFDLQELAKILDDQEDLELNEEKYSEVFNVIVECSDETEQEKVFNRLDSEGYKCRVQSL